MGEEILCNIPTELFDMLTSHQSSKCKRLSEVSLTIFEENDTNRHGLLSEFLHSCPSLSKLRLRLHYGWGDGMLFVNSFIILETRIESL